MISEKISSIEAVGKLYNSLGERTANIVTGLRNYFDEVNKRNTWAKNTNIFVVFWQILLLLAGVAVLLLWDIVVLATSNTIEHFLDLENGTLTVTDLSVLKLVVIGFIVSRIYAIVKNILNLQLVKCRKRINRVEKQIIASVAQVRSQSLLEGIRDTLNKNMHMDFPTDNKLGDEVMSIRDQIGTMDQRLGKAKKVSAIILAFLLGGLALFGILFEVAPQLKEGLLPETSMLVATMQIFVIEVIVIIMINVGPYLGKFTKPLGFGLAAVFSLVYMLVLKGKTACAIDSDLIGLMEINTESFFFSNAMLVPLFTMLGMFFIIAVTQLGGEVDKLTNGYEVKMAYGEEKRSNKARVYFLGALYGVNIFILLYLMRIWVREEKYAILIFGGLFWWLINSTIRPRGSRLYAFWGRWRCVANETFLMILCITTIIAERGEFSSVDLFILGFIFVTSKIVGGVATIINNIVV